MPWIHVLDHEYKYWRHFTKGQHGGQELYLLEKFPESRVCLSLSFPFSVELPRPALILPWVGLSSARKTVRGTLENLPLGACRGRAAALPAAQHRLPTEAGPSESGVQRQFEADFRSDLRNVTCFQRRRVVLVSRWEVEFGGYMRGTVCPMLCSMRCP